MKYSIDQQGLNKMINDLQKKSDNALEICGEYLKRKLQEQLRVDKRYDLGNLVGSIQSVKVKPGLVEVGSALVYAPVMEYGRQPGKFPPLQSLVGWTARKGMIKGGPQSNYENLHYTDKGVIYVIARAIAIKGIKGKRSFQKTLDNERKNIKKLYIENMQ